MKNFKKLNNVTAHIGRVDVNLKSRLISTHNCQESQLIEETCPTIREDCNGKQHVADGIVFKCSICGATFRKEEE